MKATANKILSKTSLKIGLQCPKALYLKLYKPELETPTDPSTQAQFDEGNEVGELARQHFGKGALVQAKHYELEKSVQITKQFINTNEKTIFEASFTDGKIYCRVDILTRSSPTKKWRLIEVKKSSELKDDHLDDVNVQAVILKRAGINIESYSVMYLNRECQYPNLKNLFITEDITDQVLTMLPEMEEKIEKLLKIAKAKTEPPTKIGRHCENPYDCNFKDHCWKHIPDYSVFELPGVGLVTGLKYLEQGIVQIKAMSPQSIKNAKQKRAIEVTKSGKRFIDVKAVEKAIKGWKYPLYFMDFETVRPAIPRYNGCWPYMQIPYQFSCHVLTKPGAKPTHFEYLHLETSDPREPFIKNLIGGIGDKGSIVSYNKAFEADRLKELASVFPKYKKPLEAIVERLVDPLPIFRDHVYDKEFRGSFSIKSVAPALLGKKFDYSSLEISDGDMAGVWAEGILRGLTAAADVPVIEKNLLDYCRRDTLAMMELVGWLTESVG